MSKLSALLSDCCLIPDSNQYNSLRQEYRCVFIHSINIGQSLLISGSLTEVRTYVTLSRGVILKVYLAEALAAEVQLFVRYTNTESGESRNLTSVSYVQSKEIVFFDENIPYDKFTVEVALMSDSLMGPLYQDHRMHGM